MGKPRRFKNPRQLEEMWEAYKAACDNRVVLTHEFSAKNSEFVSKDLKRSVSYTIEGFCLFAKISRKCFYETYAQAPGFSDTVTRMREECEVDAREKFELGILPTQLAGLWMANYGYRIKTDSAVSGAVPVVIAGGDALAD